jgi:phosphatidylglycerophosphatase C
MHTGDATELPETVDALVPRTVLFDFDGVLIYGDAFYQFVRYRYAQAWPRKLLAFVSLPWLLLQLPFSRRLPMRSLVHTAFVGVSEQRYTAAAQAFAAMLVRRPKQFNRDALQALRRHQAAGDRVIVVTGCEQTLVGSILQQLGLGDIEVVASQLRPGALGMRIKLHNIGRQKVKQLGARGIEAWQLAYSDSSIDIPMLKVAGEAVLVNGAPAVCKKIERALGRSVTRVEWY